MTDFDDPGRFVDGPRLPAHVYVHVPFCASKCDYCDFSSVAGASPATIRAVFTGVKTQLTRWQTTGLEGVLETVYVGGGTPSLVVDEVAGVLGRIAEQFVVHPRAEITVEANPDSLISDAVRTLRDAGTTRISVGVQSFDDGVLRMLGRRHDARRASLACEAVVESGLALSVDLICGVPGQTMASWAATLERVLATGARHVSVYPLAIEEGTPLAAAVSTGLVAEPDPDEAAEMMVLAEELLGQRGIARYEVANYAAAGCESVHNTAYWTGAPYLGVGPAAHGMLDAATARAVGLLGDAGDAEREAARVRYANAADIDDWLTLHGDTVELLSSDEARREDVMLGMRLTRGIPAEQVSAAGLDDVFASLARDALVELTGADGAARWRATRRGWLLGNEVFGRIWAGE